MNIDRDHYERLLERLHEAERSHLDAEQASEMLSYRLSERDDRIRALQQELNEAKHERNQADLRADNATTHEYLLGFGAVAEAAGEALRNVQLDAHVERIRELEEALERVSAISEERRTHLRSVQHALVSCGHTRRALERELSATNERLSEMLKERDAAGENYREMARHYEQASRELGDLHRELTAVKAAADETQTACDNARRIARDSGQQVADLQRQAAIMAAALGYEMRDDETPQQFFVRVTDSIMGVA